MVVWLGLFANSKPQCRRKPVNLPITRQRLIKVLKNHTKPDGDLSYASLSAAALTVLEAISGWVYQAPGCVHVVEHGHAARPASPGTLSDRSLRKFPQQPLYCTRYTRPYFAVEHTPGWKGGISQAENAGNKLNYQLLVGCRCVQTFTRRFVLHWADARSFNCAAPRRHGWR